MAAEASRWTRRGMLVAAAAIPLASLIPMPAGAQSPVPPTGAEPQAVAAIDDRWITAIAVSGDGRLMAAAATAGTIGVWRIEDAKLVQTISVPATQNSVGALAFSDDSRTLLVGNAPQRRRSKGRSMLVFDIESGEPVGEAAVEPNWVAQVASSPKASVVATIGRGYDRSVRFWNKDGLSLERLWPAHGSAVMALAMSRDGRRLATGGGNTQRGGKDPSIKIWDVADGRELRKLEGHTDSLGHLAFMPDGRRLVSIGSDAVKIWDVDTGASIRTIKLGNVNAGVMALSPDGAWFALLIHADDRKSAVLQLRSVDTGKTLRQWDDPVPSVQVLAWSPDGHRLLAGGEGGRVVVWDVPGGQLRHTFTVPVPSAR